MLIGIGSGSIPDIRRSTVPVVCNVSVLARVCSIAGFSCVCVQDTPILQVRKVRSPEEKQWLLLPKDFNNKKLKAQPTELPSTSSSPASEPSSAKAAAEA